MDTLKKVPLPYGFFAFIMSVTNKSEVDEITDSKKPTTRRLRFAEQQIRQLESNPNVLHVTEKLITYAPSFKMAAVHAHKEGKMPQEIFEEDILDDDS